MNEKQLETIKQALDEQANSYDAATLSRLRQRREKALLALDKKSNWFASPVPVAFASACILALGVFAINSNSLLNNDDGYPQVVNELLLDDSLANALVTEEIDMEFYENIDFYTWLEQSNETGQNSEFNAG